MTTVAFKEGRHFLARLPKDVDLISAIETLCTGEDLQTAVFSLVGSVTTATLGAYDQAQQVYVTFQKSEPMEIVSCTGNVSLKDGQPFIHAHAVLTDMNGVAVGGHIFSDTTIYAGEIHLQELLGTSLERKHDAHTGLYLW